METTVLLHHFYFLLPQTAIYAKTKHITYTVVFVLCRTALQYPTRVLKAEYLLPRESRQTKLGIHICIMHLRDIDMQMHT